MRYISTRGTAPILDFENVTLAGLANDGGLYLPESWPQLSRDEIAALAGLSYVETAVTVMAPFIGDSLSREELRGLCTAAYGRFDHGAVTPLVQLDAQNWLLELFHGPTLAFKDVALQLLGLLFERFLSTRDTHVTVVGATSGDTGSAAIDALAGRAKVDIFMLHPQGRVSDVQRRQMTTVLAPNVHNIAIDGSFDDAQALVKAMFADRDFAGRFALSAVNSINWARLMAQIVYYFYACRLLGAHRQFRRCVRRLCGRAHGLADRQADRGDERERHSAPRAFGGGLFRRSGQPDCGAVDGYPGQLQLRTAAVRSARP
jgi:threonine synthase